jgi:hypothetical protein
MKHSVYGLIFMLAMTGSAVASMACADHKSLTKILNEKYHEYRIGLAISGKLSEQNTMELFISKDGTWTAMKTNKEGMACLVDSGEGWTNIKLEIEGKKT